MIFTYNKWEDFCSKLETKKIFSIPACEVKDSTESFLVLKHDIESSVFKAYKLAEIERKYGHRGTYYVQAYLLENSKNIEILNKMKAMGHEISYHYDVMDSNYGNLDKAIVEFDINRKKFEEAGFPVVTVCQHGNPIVERKGYTSNRDFFRSEKVQSLYPNIADIMVDYKRKYGIDYVYFSDAGRRFKMIFDPLRNDVIDSEDKNIPYENLDEILDVLPTKTIISTHPHRWSKSLIAYTFKAKIFILIKIAAKILINVPIFKKIMSRYYYLAKKL